MITYILNTAILTDYGQWLYTGPLEVEQVREILQQGFVSAVGHQSSADFLSQLIGLEIPMNRIQIKMKKGDQAIILKLNIRLTENKILNKEEIKKMPFELGLLTRVN